MRSQGGSWGALGGTPGVHWSSQGALDGLLGCTGEVPGVH